MDRVYKILNKFIQFATSSIPFITGLLLLFLAVLSFLYPGYFTWPFNSIAYLPGGAIGIIAGLILLFIVSCRYRQLAVWQPGQWGENLLLLTVLLIFIAIVALGSVWAPWLEGDGNVDPSEAYGPLRLRNHFIQSIQIFQPSKGELEIAPLAWKLAGLIYIGGVVYFVKRMDFRFWDRLMALTFFAFFPSSVGFIGYIDSYAISYICVSGFLAAAYIAAQKRSWLFGFLSVEFFILSLFAHRLSIISLIYPTIYLIALLLNRFNLKDNYRVITFFIVMAITLIAGLGYAIKGDPVISCSFFGEWFLGVSKTDGVILTLWHPLLTMLSVLLPTVFVIILIIINKKRRNCIISDIYAATAFWGSITIFLTYYLVQLVNPIVIFGILDFLPIAGCVAGLFAVPTYILVRSCLKKYMYCVVVICCFMTIPNIILHRKPLIAKKLTNCLNSERSIFWIGGSPHFVIGTRFAVHAEKDPQYIPYAYEILKKGAENKGFYRTFAPANMYRLILTQYASGDVESARKNIRSLLVNWPRAAAFMVAASRERFYHQFCYEVNANIQNTSEQLLLETGDPIYESVYDICREYSGPRSESFDEAGYPFRNILVLISDTIPPTLINISRENIEIGERILSEMGMTDLINESTKTDLLSLLRCNE
jgi:hypothetical protein